MLRIFALDSAAGETVDQFAERINDAVEKYRAAKLEVQVQPIPGGECTFGCSIGQVETIPSPGGGYQRVLRDATRAEVQDALATAEKLAARASTGPRLL